MEKILRLRIDDPSRIGESRRLVLPICRLLGFPETDTSRILLVVTEMATNLVKHASEGELIIRPLECCEITGLEILSIDKGPGMVNVTRCLHNGFSTTGGPGIGLGAVRRNSQEFDIDSVDGKGTVVMSRHWTKKIISPQPFEVAGICLPMDGEDICGDDWDARQFGPRCLILVADGLGHGAAAHEASHTAVRLFRKNSSRSPAGIIQAIHNGLGSTRGGAVSVAELNHTDNVVRYAGIGNIAGRIVTNKTVKNMVSHNGIAGLNVHKIQEFSYPWHDQSVLIINSDGIKTIPDLRDHSLLMNRSPSVIAAVLFRDYNRGKDDAAVVIAKRRDKSLLFRQSVNHKLIEIR